VKISDAEHCYEYAKANPDLAFHFCSAAIKSNHLSKQNLAVSLNNRGNAYSVTGEFDKAIQDYDEAIRLNPKDANVFNNRGTAYVSKGNFDRAIIDFDEAIRLKPFNPAA